MFGKKFIYIYIYVEESDAFTHLLFSSYDFLKFI